MPSFFILAAAYPPTSGTLVATLKNHATQDVWCQPPSVLIQYPTICTSSWRYLGI